MADNYDFYANESIMDQEKRVEGHGLQKLQDKLKQTTNENPQGEKFNSYFSRNDESYLKDKQRRTSNYRIYTRKTKMNENYDNLYNHRKKGLNNDNINLNSKMNTCSYPMNNQSLSYATDMDLTPLKIKCNPILSDKNSAIEFVQEFFKRIENSFRSIYKEHKKVLEFDYWWIDNNGVLQGITKDILLNVYLCDVRNYPERIDSVQLTSLLPIRLSPQRVIVIKFVPNARNRMYISQVHISYYFYLVLKMLYLCLEDEGNEFFCEYNIDVDYAFDANRLQKKPVL
jgi:hypothetical protein